jgi:pilus assembly protein TadC
MYNVRIYHDNKGTFESFEASLEDTTRDSIICFGYGATEAEAIIALQDDVFGMIRKLLKEYEDRIKKLQAIDYTTPLYIDVCGGIIKDSTDDGK